MGPQEEGATRTGTRLLRDRCFSDDLDGITWASTQKQLCCPRGSQEGGNRLSSRKSALTALSPPLRQLPGAASNSRLSEVAVARLSGVAVGSCFEVDSNSCCGLSYLRSATVVELGMIEWGLTGIRCMVPEWKKENRAYTCPRESRPVWLRRWICKLHTRGRSVHAALQCLTHSRARSMDYPTIHYVYLSGTCPFSVLMLRPGKFVRPWLGVCVFGQVSGQYMQHRSPCTLPFLSGEVWGI
jgi:hypothetical protein